MKNPEALNTQNAQETTDTLASLNVPEKKGNSEGAQESDEDKAEEISKALKELDRTFEQEQAAMQQQEEIKNAKSLGEIYTILEQVTSIKDTDSKEFFAANVADDIRRVSGRVGAALVGQKPLEEVLALIAPDKLTGIPAAWGLRLKVIELLEGSVREELRMTPYDLKVMKEHESETRKASEKFWRATAHEGQVIKDTAKVTAKVAGKGLKYGAKGLKYGAKYGLGYPAGLGIAANAAIVYGAYKAVDTSVRVAWRSIKLTFKLGWDIAKNIFNGNWKMGEGEKGKSFGEYFKDYYKTLRPEKKDGEKKKAA